MESTVRSIAIYLPQFHPTPENDAWWGKGFTEWSNVSKAKSLFKGHYQPHLPSDLGYYDLRLSEARQAQADMAKAYGIHGFCYYHYWFEGKRLIERPFNEVLDSGKPDFPFCLCWANETWSRRWLGEEKNILMKQTYSQQDDFNHIQWLIGAFRDHRYITVNNRPLFLIYRPMDLPSPEATIEIFRKECVKAGLANPYIVGVNAHRQDLDLKQKGFDDILDFTPQLGVLPEFMQDGYKFSRLIRNFKQRVWSGKLKVYDYNEAYDLINRRNLSYEYIPSVFVSWDNTARRGENGIIFKNADPERFALELRRAIKYTMTRPESERFVFINAWNEWAEGNHLEPDIKNGLRYLEIVRKACKSNIDG